MTDPTPPVEPRLVVCETCLKEVPVSEAIVPEAQDYVAYFCGLECFERWRRQGAAAAEASPPPEPPAPR